MWTQQYKNDKLAYVVERFKYHSEMAQTSDNPIIVDAAKTMCGIEMLEMWLLTQE